MKNIAVFYGGKSVEHDISVITAMQAMVNLGNNYNVYPVYIKPDGTFITADNLMSAETYLDFANNVKNSRVVSFLLGLPCMQILKNGRVKKQINIDCALLCNHGHGGEDGSLQGLLELCEIPYTSCSVPSSAITMDKHLTKVLLEQAHIDTPAYVHFNRCEYEANKQRFLKEIIKRLNFPCIIKPAKLGSSVGISICENDDMLEEEITSAFMYDDKILVENFVSNAREFCCAVFKIGNDNLISNVQEVKKNKIFTFEEKYLSRSERTTSKISKDLEKRIKEYSEQSYNVLECNGIVRVDFLYNEKQDQLYVNEVNSIPGSLAFNLFNTSFTDLLSTLIEETISKKKMQKEICYTFNSEAIEKYISMTDNMRCKCK